MYSGIFYDPLLVYLESLKEDTGYSIEVDYYKDITTKEKVKIVEYHNCTTFMDDTTIIAKNKGEY